MGNPVVHWELMSKEPADVPEINYRAVDTGAKEGINGGIVKPDRKDPWPGNMLLYLLVDDHAKYRKRIVAAGGKIHVEEHKVPRMGKFSLFTDPEGRMMGLWKAKR